MHSGLLLLSQVFGLIPFNYMDCKRKIYDYILMFIVPCFYMYSYLMSNLPMYSLRYLPTCGNICSLGSTIFINLGLFVYITDYVLSLLRGKYFFPEFYRRLEEIDDVLNKCQKTVKPIQKSINWIRYINLTIFLSIILYAIYKDVTKQSSFFEGKFSILSTMSMTFPYLATSIVQVQFSYLVSVISKRFKKLIEILDILNKECSKKNLPVKIFDIETDGSMKKQIQMNFQVEKNEFVKKNDSENEDDQTESEKEEDMQQAKEYPDDELKSSEKHLVDIFWLHDKILTLSRLTNHEFGGQTVPYMVVCFVTAIFAIFLYTKVYLIVRYQTKVLVFVVEMYIYWGFITVVVAYLVLRFCCNANSYSKKAAMIVHEIMQKKPQFMMGNDVYYNKMKSFTLQFLHWDGFFQYNGIGMYTLDYTFIFSTVSAATSYLIVLLQFDMNPILINDGFAV